MCPDYAQKVTNIANCVQKVAIVGHGLAISTKCAQSGTKMFPKIWTHYKQ